MKRTTKELLSLDANDQKILAELFKNGRSSYATIAKKTALSKEIVQYRISQLIKTGVMTNVNTIINIQKLGWNSSLVLLKLRNLHKAKEFVKDSIENPFVVEILELAGGWDFAIRFYHKDVQYLYALINNMEISFPSLIDKYEIIFIEKNIFLPYNALFENFAFLPSSKKLKTYDYDKLDLKILEAISFDSRKSFELLQRELNENRMTIYNRINKMIESGIIDGFRPNLFTEKLGFHWYEINLKMIIRSEEKLNSIIEKLKDLKKIHFMMKTFGFADIIFYMQVKTVQELQKVLYTLREQFGKDIKSIESANVIKDYKWDFFPKGFLKEFYKQK